MTARVTLRSRLHWRRWGDEWVVYDSGSGQTHKLDRLTAVVLLTCEEGVVDPPGLVERVAQALAVDASDELAGRVRQVVEQCETLGLLESVA